MKKSVKRDRGHYLNSDIILTIAKLLHPIDMFSLSFTCRLNHLVIAANPRIWERARRLKIPARVMHPPNGMSERQYSWFLVSEYCSQCHQALPCLVDWILVEQSCRACYRSHDHPLSTISRARDQESFDEYRDPRRKSIEGINLLRHDWDLRTSSSSLRFFENKPCGDLPVLVLTFLERVCVKIQVKS